MPDFSQDELEERDEDLVRCPSCGRSEWESEMKTCPECGEPMCGEHEGNCAACTQREGACSPAPCSRFRNETLERYPPGHPQHDTIKGLAQRWVKTGEWRFRKNLVMAAGILIEDAESIYEPSGERDPWITAECAVDLANLCRAYLKTFDSYTSEISQKKS